MKKITNCVQGVASPLLANLYLHVVFDGWMKQNYPGIRFERYADDIIIHCRREQIAQSILQKLYNRFTECGLTIHPDKTQIICLDRSQTKGSERKVHTFEMGGYEFKPQWVKVEGEWKLRILPSPSKASKKAIMDKIRSLKLHTRTGSIYVVANLINPLVDITHHSLPVISVYSLPVFQSKVYHCEPGMGKLFQSKVYQ